MNLKKDFNKKDLILIISLIGIYFLTRSVNLLLLPIFTDEAIYMRWAQIALHDASWRFISLTDGKQPLFIWLSMIVMKFVSDPLFSGRLVSVLAGFSTLVGLFLLGWEAFKSKKIGYLTAVIYLFSPFFLWYDRMAIMDSLLVSFFIWSILFEILLFRNLRLDIALILGFIIGGAVLTKTSGFFAIYLLPLFLLVFDWKKKKTDLFKIFVLTLISSFIALIFYSILRLSPWFYIIIQKDHSFIYTFSEILKDPVTRFFGNMKGLVSWWFGYFTLSYLVLAFVSLIIKDKKSLSVRLLFILIFLIPLNGLAVFGKVLYPRYILFMTVSLLPLIAFALYQLLDKLRKPLFKIIFLIIVFIYPVYFCYTIITDPVNAPLPQSDRRQYLDDWPAGFGIKEVVAYLKIEKQKQPIFVATEGTFGLFPYSLELEFFSDPTILIKPYWPLPAQETVIKEAEGKPIFLLLKESQELPSGWSGQLINQYQRGKGETYLKFFKINQ